ncbi:MAG: hypothetical protein LBL13_04775 [Bacteroidales bacterium]|nr:hypothetical protein [Bacteroidales bacterium]
MATGNKLQATGRAKPRREKKGRKGEGMKGRKVAWNMEQWTRCVEFKE